jgi:hypothetical protein
VHTLGVESSLLNWGKSDLVFRGFRINASALIFLIPLLLATQGTLVELVEVELVLELRYFCTLGGEGVDVLDDDGVMDWGEGEVERGTDGGGTGKVSFLISCSSIESSLNSNSSSSLA